ncbi:MAG: hypothetical protein JWO40_673 [Candidatus Doudnabacteria bacterium]|nr:hypothetical protein [Candidatus Doudnabacteria bacterium]
MDTQTQIIGIWVLAPDGDNKKAYNKFGDVTMNFQADGKLTYSTSEGDKNQYIFLTYQIEGDYLVTNQPSAPREERTKIKLTNDGKLHMLYDGIEGVFVKKNTLD